MASWIATALGLAGGFALALALGQAVLPRLVRNRRDLRFAVAGAAIAVLPALVLSVIVGGAFGSAWARQAGVAIGTALVFAAVLLACTIAGLALAGLLRS